MLSSSSAMRMRLLTAAGELHHHARSTFRRKLGLDPAAVHLDDLPADIEAKAHAGAMVASMGLVEPLEEVGTVLRRNTHARIAHRQPHDVGRRLGQLDVYQATLRTE